MPSVHTRVSGDGKQVTIQINGRFDFSVHQEFRDAYINRDPHDTSFVLDLSRTEYMDSSALGMVLLLKEFAGNDSRKVEIRNARPEVEKILRIANFDKLVEMA
ncbi:MAG TPA: anti-sigma factor antagonist [Gammaproteobacteria bacterium]|nr:anti-sigma factor antagonist [Gammaproteobacteria bacterium]